MKKVVFAFTLAFVSILSFYGCVTVVTQASKTVVFI